MINLETRQAYLEVNEILKILGEDYSDKLPDKVKSVIQREMDTEYNVSIDISKPINEMHLKRKTIAIISAFNLQYWCNDEDEKQKLKNIYYENGIKYQQELEDTYSTENLFKNNITKNTKNTEETALLVYQEELPFYKKIFLKIKEFFQKV